MPRLSRKIRHRGGNRKTRSFRQKGGQNPPPDQDPPPASNAQKVQETLEKQKIEKAKLSTKHKISTVLLKKKENISKKKGKTHTLK